MKSILYSWILVLSLVSSVCGNDDKDKLLTNKNDFMINSDNRLLSNYFIYSNTELCKKIDISDIISHYDHHREIGVLQTSYSPQFFDGAEAGDSRACSLACIDIGTPIDLIQYIFPEKKYTFQEETFSKAEILKWFNQECMQREVGFVSSIKNPIDLFWIDPTTEKRIQTETVLQGERNTVWQNTVMGHVFEAVDSATQEVVGRYQVSHDSFFRIGPLLSSKDVTFASNQYEHEREVRDTLNIEYDRSKTVKRTFTKLGFDKSRLPNDIFCSMSTFYYNNRNNLALEEWKSKGLHVNWWQVDSQMIVMPWKLKKYWQDRLKPLVETWTNTTLELTDIYGLRRYNEGARLLTHVDRTSTHATSIIINIAQGNVSKPWPVEIYDHGGRLHEIEMNPGDIVYYESAICLHGRNQPLAGPGSYYVNLFTHYRPIGDDKWYTKPTSPDHTQPLIDLPANIDIHRELPTVSSSGDEVHSGADLFNWWKKTSPKRRGEGDIITDEL